MRVLIIEDEQRLAQTIARGLGRYGAAVDIALDGEAGLSKALVNDYDVVVLGTISASLDTQQAQLAGFLLGNDTPVIIISLRTPYDIVAFPTAPTYVCAYGVRRTSLDAAAACLFGSIPFTGRLPVAVGTDYPAGFAARIPAPLPL